MLGPALFVVRKCLLLSHKRGYLSPATSLLGLSIKVVDDPDTTIHKSTLLGLFLSLLKRRQRERKDNCSSRRRRLDTRDIAILETPLLAEKIVESK